MKEIIWSGASPVLMPREDPAGKIVFLIVVLVVVVICFVALMTFMAAVLRGTTERSKSAIATKPWPTVLAGVIGYGIFGGLAAWLYAQAFIVRLLETEVVAGFLVAALAVTVIPLLLSLLGAPGLFSDIGERIAVLHGGDFSGIRRIVWGTCLSILAALFPVLGWFVVLPLLLILSFGGGMAAVLRLGR